MKKFQHKLGHGIFAASIACVLLMILGRCIYLKTAAFPDRSPTLYAMNGSLLNVRITRDEKWRLANSPNLLNSLYAQGLICIEDKHFVRHMGVDLFAVARAISQAMVNGRIISGASTLPMQTVRMIHRNPRNVSAKIAEMIDATLLSFAMSKEEILEVYALRVPMGGNIEGVETAAQIYFRKPVKELDLRELSTLYLIPQHPQRVADWSGDQWAKASTRILKRLHGCNLISLEQLEAAIKEPLPIPKRHSLPRNSEHLADYLCPNNIETCQHRTTIDGQIQAQIQEMLSHRQAGYNSKNIHNIAVGVVDNASGAVIALIGNFNYMDTDHGQKIASFAVRRSPGSTLKPLIFALSLDERLIVPETLIEDRPMNFGSYSPENYNSQFSGLVRAQNALSQSLNIPFVQLLSDLGIDRFLFGMDAAGVVERTPNEKLGLSLAIGGIDIQFLELLRLYHGFAIVGAKSNLHLLADSNVHNRENADQFVSEGAAYLTARALRQRDRPESAHLSHVLGKASQIAWKTGTSQNRLDAWSIGFDSKYSVAVWLGNLNQQSSPHLIGAEAAAPLMFDIFSALHEGASSSSTSRPYTVSSAEVCALSGFIPGPACESRTLVDAIEGQPPQKTCPYHQHVFVEKSSGKATAPQCLNGNAYEIKSVSVLPRRIKRWIGEEWLSTAGTETSENLSCAPDIQQTRINIQSPKNNSRFVLWESVNGGALHIPFRAFNAGSKDPIQCFLNGQKHLLHSYDVLKLSLGNYRLYCTDRFGNSDVAHFRISSGREAFERKTL